ncbi:hypothetical protein [Flavobacterium hydatis]|uniref:Uncharacterized protein n=1 Tax=Flavobacterium hydatis TaxID=991 RepID=A0A086AKY2_FLAHY|nr:hypothetical protein [Flavobacterium hydatis]KFF17346.1 hypothetical protein IW20_08365 [Flavobacterium hydatis]OXA95179.1 hypothetical protein B0A62_09780 [Flavobacterium hydatis]
MGIALNFNELNIERYTKPLVKDTEYIGILSGIINFMQWNVRRRLNRHLGKLIQGLENTDTESFTKATPEQLENLLIDVNNAIQQITKLDEDFSKVDYLKKSKVHEKIEKILAAFYKIESILHKTKYKNIPIEKTSPKIIEGITKMNRRNMSKLISF